MNILGKVNAGKPVSPMSKKHCNTETIKRLQDFLQIKGNTPQTNKEMMFYVQEKKLTDLGNALNKFLKTNKSKGLNLKTDNLQSFKEKLNNKYKINTEEYNHNA
jgi:hypothetical protein